MEALFVRKSRDNSIRRLLLLSLLLALVLRPHEARADYSNNVAVLQCDPPHNRVLIRFGALSDESPGVGAPIDANDPMLKLAEIPENFSPWSDGIRMQNAGSCVLADGHRIVAKAEDGAMTSGQGGVDPNTFFKLSIDGRYVYDRMRFYRGHSRSTFDLSAIAFEGSSLIECDPHERADYGRIDVESDPKCRDVSNRLKPGSESFTAGEKAELVQDSKRSRLAAALSPFCRTLVRPYSPFFKESATQAESDKEEDVDVNNDGKTDRMFFFKNGTGGDLYDDFGYLVSFTHNLSSADAFAKQFAGQVFPDQKLVAAAAAKAGGHIIRFATENLVISVRGSQYIYAFDPFPDVVPSATLTEILPDNAFRQICAFP